jgi:SpoIID/LytB domain protein
MRSPATGFGAGYVAAVMLAAALIGARTPASQSPAPQTTAPPAQTEVSDAVLEKASEGRTVDIGLLSSGGGPPSPRYGGTSVATIPLELYVARVLAGEAEPGAADAAQQALAVAIRTYAIVNAGRHRREGFDLCDTTHCQVMRTANDYSRRAALATAGRVLTLGGRPVEIFYSASCGGRSESAADVWPGGTRFPYLRSVRDDVHEDEVPWVLTLTLDEIRQALMKAGFGGDRLRDIEIDERTGSGRVARLHVRGLRPDAIDGGPFRMAIGPRQLRSTAFSLTRTGNSVRFTGVGYGHGVGMCVIGAGRRARRGESLEAILGQYFPGLALMSLNVTAPVEPPLPVALEPPRPPIAPPVTAPPPAVPPAAAVVPAASTDINVRVPNPSPISAGELGRLALRLRESLSKTLGTSTGGVTVELHSTIDGFRYETGRPWWVSAAVKGTTIDLAPAALLAQRDGVETTLRTAMAELLVSPTFSDRPAWVRVGAARYFSRSEPQGAVTRDVKCPADAELTMALSATAQREAESRAERCFAREVAKTGDWRSVK